MPVLTLDYRHCDRKRPKFIKHVEIEAIAAQARQQLVGNGIDAMVFDTLRQIDRQRQPYGTGAHHDDRVFGHARPRPILIGMAAIAKRGAGVRHEGSTL